MNEKYDDVGSCTNDADIADEKSRAFTLALEQWRKCLGEKNVYESKEAIQRFGKDTGCDARQIPAALTPSNVSEVKDIVRIAQEYAVPISPVSSGRNWGYGGANPVQDNCVVINLSGLNRIRMFDPETSLVTVEAGVTQEQLRSYLDERGLDLMIPATGSGPGCSLLGNVMERGFGITPHSDHFKATTTIEAVLPDGSLYKPAMHEMGGEAADQVFKWGVGPYLDGIFTQGSFGIVTAMTFALAPMPECVESFFFKISGKNIDSAVESVRSMLRDLPGMVVAVNLMNQYRLVSTIGDFPKDLVPENGPLPREVVAELAKKHRLPEWMGMGAIYCPKSFVRKARREVRKRLAPIKSFPVFLNPARLGFLAGAAKMVPGKAGISLREYIDTVTRSLDIIKGRPSEIAMPMCYWRSGKKPVSGKNFHPANDGCGLMWYMALVPLKKDLVKQYSEMVESVCLKNGIEPFLTLTVVSEQCIESTVPLLFDRENKEAFDRARKCYDELFNRGREIGVMPNRLSVDQMHYYEDGAPEVTKLVRRLHKALDPNRIMLPGRYGA